MIKDAPSEELDTIKFHRENACKRPTAEHLLTLEDMDEHKLPATDKLLRKIISLRKELAVIKLFPQQKEKNRRYKDLFLFTDTEYKDWPDFKIKIRSYHLDPEWFCALHTGFNFHLRIMQDGDGRGEIADWIDINIQYLNTVPTSLAARREHVCCLGGESYFANLNLEHRTFVSFDRMDEGLSFKTKNYNHAVDDACKVLDKIIARKKFLEEVEED
jgi:hypothetical protein